MTANLLWICQEFCRRQGLEVPTQVMTSRDNQLLQLVGLAHEVIEDLTERYRWQELVKETVWTSLAAESQGTLETLAPFGFESILNETIFDRTDQRQLFGPQNATQWQAAKAAPYTGPYHAYYIRGNQLLIVPTMPAGHTMAFEYESTWSIQNGATYKRYFTADADIFLLDEALMLAGLRWKWKYEKGVKYNEDWEAYDNLANSKSSKNGTKKTLQMDGTCPVPIPGIFVPSGNWPTSM